MKIGLISLGCAKNQVNSEQMLWLLREAGYAVSLETGDADAVIVNTCGFIESAKSEAIEQILALGEEKRAGRLGKIIVTGCLSQRYKQEVLDELPEVDAVLGCGSFDRIVFAVNAVLDGERPAWFGDIDADVEETARVLTTGPGWAYLKIAEGCDNRCAYCVIPTLRGKYRSRPMENLLAEARALSEGGVKELILVAQDITRYGVDLYGRRSLHRLLSELAQIPGLKWLRLHYLYPDEIDDQLIEVIVREDKILPYLDIPIQHISDKVLAAMNRRGTGEEIRALFRTLRARIPGLVLRTSLITGLPGEREAEFESLCDFLREEKLERAGVFPYSPEEGTIAAEMPNRPGQDVAERRAELARALEADIMDAYARSRIGKMEAVLCEGYDGELDLFYGRSYAESPDVDGRILLRGEGLRPGAFVRARLIEMRDGELLGVAQK